MDTRQTIKVLLINLGGPRNAKEVSKFLKDLLTDPYMIDTPLPNFFQKFLFKLIAIRRARQVAHKYESMGFDGGSPIVKETMRQAQALEAKLKDLDSTKKWQINIAMTCGEPNVRNLSPQDLTPAHDNLVVPLYPQFSRSTTMSLARIVEKSTRNCVLSSPYTLVDFYNDPGFIESVSSLIFDFLNQKAELDGFIKPDQVRTNFNKDTTILFSAHGIPMRLVSKGDKYPEYVNENVKLISENLRQLGFEGSFELSYQSRVGKGQWTAPSTIEMLQRLGQGGCRDVCVYPLSFVSDHLETLEEIDLELREIAHASGIERFTRIPAPGCWPAFIDFLAHKVIELQKGHLKKDTCVCLESGGEKSPNCVF